MKTIRSGFYIGLACCVVAGASTSAATERKASAVINHTADIAVFDRILAAAKPTDRWVKFGDVGIPYASLKIYRDRLAGKLESPRDGQTADPNVVTPAGLTFKWPNGDVYYRFDPTQAGNGTITALKMQQFRDGIAEWAAFANLHFIEVTSPLPANYITVQEDPGSGAGFSSSVGMAGGEQFVVFGPNAWNRGTICHEVGHALGLWHEQQRPDRDTYVTINFNNIPPGSQANFTIISDGQTFSTPYDFYSTMHYRRNTFAIDSNQDTIIMNPGYTQYANLIGNTGDRVLSKSERAGMAAIYGNPSTLPGSVVTNTNDSGPGSLRTAIYYAFDRSPSSSPSPSPPVATTITFNIPTNDPGYNSGTGLYTIKPTASLPSMGSGTTINGNAQIVLDGSIFTQLQVPPLFIFSHGLSLRAANCAIQGLTIINFNQSGIFVYQDNDPNGTATTGNVIGGTMPAARNVISGNADYGIGMRDPTTMANTIQGNYIGTDQAGANAQPNQIAGVVLFLGTHNNTIGGTAGGARNVISGNMYQAIFMGDAGTNNNVVQGNYIGLNAAGTGAIPNGGAGIEINAGAQSNMIGGTTSAARNIISGNGNAGVAIDEFNDVTSIGTRNNVISGNYIGLNPGGTAAIPNQSDGISIFGGAPSNTIGGTAAGAGNVISGNAFAGVAISGSGTNGNMVQGNIIGLKADGSAIISNGSDGVAMFGGCQSNTIGGTTAAARNVISGNSFSGISIGGNQTNSNLVQGNYVGVDITGLTAMGNTFDGIAIYGDGPAPSPSPTAPPNTGPQSNIVGGTVPAARNIIAGNGGSGISIGNPGTNGTNNNTVQGNFIGLNANGSSVPNNFSGIAFYGGAQTNTVGGTVAGASNVIARNNGAGVSMGGNGCNGNILQGNYIGLDPAGTAQPNGGNGIDIFGGGQNNTIGGTVAGSRNFISGNAFSGIAISGIGTNNNVVQGNTIGLNPGGSIVANGSQGIALFQSSPGDLIGPESNVIGGNAFGASNIIAGNTFEGVALFNNHTIRNKISQNSIFSNHFAGIGRYDASNNSQPSPSLTSAVLSPTMSNSSGTDIGGSFNGPPSVVEFFASPAGNEGRFFIGSAPLGGTGAFNVSLSAAVPAGYVITATATDANGNTSAFSGTWSVTTSTDSDSDGIPDIWMVTHFGHPTGSAGDKSRAIDDADGDGLTNSQEFNAGTDPNNSASRFAITSIDRPSGTSTISFQPVAGKTYRLEYRESLNSGNWINLVNGIFAPNNSVIQIIDPSGTGLSRRFYRVDLEP